MLLLLYCCCCYYYYYYYYYYCYYYYYYIPAVEIQSSSAWGQYWYSEDADWGLLDRVNIGATGDYN